MVTQAPTHVAGARLPHWCLPAGWPANGSQPTLADLRLSNGRIESIVPHEGAVAGGWQLGRAALIAAKRLEEGTGDAAFYRGKISTARFYADCLLPQAGALAQSIVHGSESVLALADEQF